MAETYRLVTRSDFDGLTCAVLLKELGMIDEVVFVHPKDMQDGKVQITSRDITTNLPYVPACYLCFDHHASELERVEGDLNNRIIDPDAPSAARVVYKHFGGKERFPGISDELMEAVDRADSAQYEVEDVIAPKRWTLLSFIMDPRTGLGRFREFRISNYQLMMALIEHIRTMSVEDILDLPDVKERVDLYFEQEKLFKEQLSQIAKPYGKVVVIDQRHTDTVYAGNRFMVYALYADCTVSIHVMWGFHKQNTVLAIGKSIFDRSAQVHVGDLCLQHGGGGHAAAGTCQVENDRADAVLKELVAAIKAAG